MQDVPQELVQTRLLVDKINYPGTSVRSTVRYHHVATGMSLKAQCLQAQSLLGPHGVIKEKNGLDVVLLIMESNIWTVYSP